MVQFLSRIRIAAKLWLGYGAVGAVLAGLALVQLGILHDAERQALRMFETRVVPVRKLKAVSDAYGIRIPSAMRQVRSGALEPSEGLARIRVARAEAVAAWTAFRAVPSEPDPGTVWRVEALTAAANRDLDRLEGILAEGRAVDDDLLPQLLPLTELVARLADAQEEAAERSLADTAVRVRRIRLLSYGVIVAGLAAAMGLGYWISRHLSDGLRRLVDQVRLAAAGDLEAPIPVAGRDEVADLGRELNRMVHQMRETIRALGEREASERAVLQNAQVAIIVRDAGGVVRRFNAYAESLLGFRAEELIGRSTAPWLDRGEVAARSRELEARQGRPVTDDNDLVRCLTLEGPDLREWTFVTREGHRRPMLVALSTILGADGGPVGYVSIASDLSWLKALEADLRASEARARAANRAKSAFLSNMSHELRTPLNAVLGYAQLMDRKEGRSAEDREHLGRILGAGEHLLTLINDILSLSKIESGGLDVRAGPFRAAGLLEAALDMQRIRARDKGLELRVEAAPGFPAYLEGDEAKLRQILVNLVGNAVKFTERGAVVLRAGYADGWATFAVEDTGPGIAAEDQRLLFRPFFQGSAAAGGEGTGLGLHISRSLVRLMGGELELDSRPGEGTRFSFSLPLSEGEPPPELLGGGRVVGLEPGQRPVRMLVADDRVENRDLLVGLLASVGLPALAAADGIEAVELWEQHRPDLVWMDLRMPRMDGFAALEAIRGKEREGNAPPTCVVAISASVLDTDRDALLRAGFDDFLGKPFREAELFDVMSRLLGLRFLVREPESEPEANLKAVLALQSAPWRAEVKEAVLIGDVEGALGLVDRLEPSAAESLRRFLKAYKLQEVLDALEG
ncbi:ATP-binding protein [Geothrix sp. 21YS21S-4]|uniref:ATP-binding protein n=1 Tax=Geothrix sp. 21YS21S-4 TaxID=3068889 RepID=UPI0027BAF48B|nr:ATP-binding protein [Geothrix sp. 21YS21S-4]